VRQNHRANAEEKARPRQKARGRGEAVKHCLEMSWCKAIATKFTPLQKRWRDCYLRVATEMMESSCTELKMFEQHLNVVSVSTEHVIQHRHSTLDEGIDEQTTILAHTNTRISSTGPTSTVTKYTQSFSISSTLTHIILQSIRHYGITSYTTCYWL